MCVITRNVRKETTEDNYISACGFQRLSASDLLEIKAW